MPRKSAHSTNGTTAMPITDTVSSRHTGPASSSTSRPVTNVVIGRSASFSVESRTGPFSSRPMTRYTTKTIATTTHTQRRLRDDGPSPQQPAGDPWHERVERVAQTLRADHDVLSERREPRGRVDDAADDHEISAHARFGLDEGASADDHERAVEHGGLRQTSLAEDDDHVVIDNAVDRRVAGNHDGLLDRGVRTSA